MNAPPPVRRSAPRLGPAFLHICRRGHIPLTRYVLVVEISRQRMNLFGRTRSGTYEFKRRFCISSSRFGVGNQPGSNRTPLGLHRVTAKIGGGHPIGTVFRSRQAVGLIWKGLPEAPIAHRILWLGGVEPGLNQGNGVDTGSRYIYIHGLADEPTLGRPASRGCIHMAASDLLPLYDLLPVGTLVWITEFPIGTGRFAFCPGGSR